MACVACSVGRGGMTGHAVTAALGHESSKTTSTRATSIHRLQRKAFGISREEKRQL